MSEEPKLIISEKSQPISDAGKTVFVEIYRLENANEWALSIDDEFNNTSSWNNDFKTEDAALIEAKRAILEEGIHKFIGPESGKGEWK
ncbi:MAG: hypothetical protein RPT11_10125 [Bermanella sp.]